MKKIYLLLSLLAVSEIGLTQTQTTNFITKFHTTPPTITNSILYDNGTKLGIGTTSPTELLTIFGASSPSIHIRTNAAEAGGAALILGNSVNRTAGKIFFNSESETTYGGANSLNIYNSASAISFHTGGNQNVLFMATSGNIGIGTSAPGYALHVSKSVADYAMKIHNTAGSGSGVWIRSGAGSSAGYALLVEDDYGTDLLRVNADTDSPSTYVRELFVSAGSGTPSNFPDYVFKKDYKLKSLGEVEEFIAKNGHLQGLPSACEVEEKGTINVNELQLKLLEKVEELTLYVIELKKENELLKQSLKNK